MLIGLNGFLGSGKDTVYKRIAKMQDRVGWPAERVSFADKLKLSAAAALGVWNDDPIAWMNLIKDEGTIRVSTADGTFFEFSGRQYLQWYGTESHRDVFSDNFWVDQALPPLFNHTNRIVCVTDVRFPNEISRVKELGGTIWNVKGVDDTMAGSHASEIPIPKQLVDVWIDNTERDDDFYALDAQVWAALSIVQHPLVRN